MEEKSWKKGCRALVGRQQILLRRQRLRGEPGATGSVKARGRSLLSRTGKMEDELCVYYITLETVLRAAPVLNPSWRIDIIRYTGTPR